MGFDSIRKRLEEEEARRKAAGQHSTPKQTNTYNLHEKAMLESRVNKIKQSAPVYATHQLNESTVGRNNWLNNQLYNRGASDVIRNDGTISFMNHAGARSKEYTDFFNENAPKYAAEMEQIKAALNNTQNISSSASDIARARTGDRSVLNGLDEKSDEYKLYDRLLRLYGYDTTTQKLDNTLLPDRDTLHKGLQPEVKNPDKAQRRTYADLYDLQYEYPRADVERDLALLSGYKDGRVDKADRDAAAQRLGKYFGGDWSPEYIRANSAQVPMLGEDNTPWRTQALAAYDKDTQLLSDLTNGENYTYEDFVAYDKQEKERAENERKRQEEYLKWKTEFNAKWGYVSGKAEFGDHEYKQWPRNRYGGGLSQDQEKYMSITQGLYTKNSDQSDLLTIGTDYEKTGYQYMDDQERKKYAFIHDTEGSARAEEYLADLQPELWRRRSEHNAQELYEWTNENAFNATVGAVAARGANLMNNAAGMINTVRKVTGEQINPYDPIFDYGQYAQIIDSTNMQNIADATEGTEIFGINPFEIGYGALTSAADSALTLPFGHAGAVVQAFGAANNTFRQGLLDNKSQLSASIDAVVDGLIEAGTEYFSIDALLSDTTSAVKYLLRNAGVEPLEELTGEGLRLGYDTLRYGENDITRRVEELLHEGYSPDDAMRQSLKEYAHGLAETAITASVAGSVGGAPGAVNIATENRRIGNALTQNQTVDQLFAIAEGLPLSERTKAMLREQQSALQAQRAAESQGRKKVVEATEEAPETESGRVVKKRTDAQGAEEVVPEAEEVVPEAEDTTEEEDSTEEAVQVDAEVQQPDKTVKAGDDKDTTEPVQKKKSKKEKQPKLSVAKIGMIFREAMANLDAQAQAVLSDSFTRTTIPNLLNERAAMDKTTRDEPMQQMLAKSVTKAIYSPTSLTMQERQLLSSSNAAMSIVQDMTARVFEADAIRNTAGELASMTAQKPAQAATDAGEEMIEAEEYSPEEAAERAQYTLEQHAAEYGKNADIMRDAYTEGQDVLTYAQQFRRAYDYGSDGRNLEIAKASPLLKDLTGDQIETAYQMGRGERQARNQARQERSPGAVPVGNVDTSAIRGMRLNAAQNASVSSVRRLAQAVGFNVKFVASTPDANGRFTKENGSWNRETRTLTIDINAGRLSSTDANYAMMQTVGHELTHYIKQFADSGLYDEYHEFVLGHLSRKMKEGDLNGRIQSVIDRNAKLGKTLTREQALDEVVADASGDALLSLTEADIMELAQTKPTLLEKIRQFIQRWVASVKALIKKGYEGQTARNPIAEQMVEVADELGRKWVALLKNAQANAQAMEKAAEDAQDSSSNTEAFYNSDEAILNQARPPYTDGTKLCTEFVESLEPEARETYDLLYNFYQASRYGRKNLSSKFMYWSEWNDMVNGNEEIAVIAKRMASTLPAKVRKAMNMDENGLLTPTTLEQEFRMSRSMGQRIIDALGDKGVEAVETTYTIEGNTYELSSGNGMTAVGGEAYRRALCNEVRKAYREGKLKQANISTLSKDNWGSMGFLATNGKTGASGDFTTLCPQMYFNRGCHYCYRLAALKTGVNNKLVGVNVWYGGEVLRMKDKDVDMLNRNGGLRIQSFGDWMPQYSSQLADMLYDADLRGLQVKIITKEPSMIEYVAKLKEQGLGKSLYFNLSCDYAIERAAKKGTADYVPMNPNRPFMFDDEGAIWWKRAMAVQEANRYRTKYPWVNTRIVATTLDEFIRGLKDPKVDVVTGYHGNIREWERIDSETGEVLLNVEALGDAGMPRFAFNPATNSWNIEYPGKTATHKKLAEAIAREGLEYEYYIKSCCITGRCATCSGKCGALAKDFNVKNATNRDSESVAYWQSHMISADNIVKPSAVSEVGEILTQGEGFASDDGISYSVREGDDPKASAQAYKLFNVDEKGLPHALFIDAANALELGTWYDADSPLIKDMEDLEPGATYYIDRDGNTELRRFNNKAQSPSKSDLEEAAREGGRFIYVGVYKDAKRKGQKSYANWGLNGSGQISTFAMRPGWHMTNVPAARHIGAGRNGGEAMYRRPNQRWFLVEYATDVDYREEAAQSPTKDIATHIPTDGWYSFRTNTNAEADQDWIISGALKIVRPVSEREAHRIAREAGVPEDLPYKDGVKAFVEDDSVIYHARESRDDDTSTIKKQIAENKTRLDAMDPVYVKKIQLPKTKKENLIKWAVDELASTGYAVDRQGFGRITFDRDRIDTSFNYLNTPGEYAAILAVPRVLKRGIIVGEHQSHKYRGFPTITFAAPVEINGVRGNMAVVVKQEKRNTYKTHRIVMPDGSAFEYKENAEPTPARGVASNGSYALPISSASDNRIAQNEDSVNQARDPEQISDRELLANTLESVARNKDELDIIRRYKARLAEWTQKQADLDALTAKIAQMEQDGANRDEIRKERNRAQILSNQISRIDGTLQHRERAEAVKAIAGRERERMRTEKQKEMRRRAEAQLEEQNRKWAEKQAKYKARLQEERARGIERVREVREEKNESFARAKYLKEVRERSGKLMETLATPTNKAYVPEFLRVPLGEFIQSLDFRSDSLLRGKNPTKADDAINSAMDRLGAALERARMNGIGEETSGNLDLPAGFVEEFGELRRKIYSTLQATDSLTDTPVNRMNSEQLHALAGVFRILQTSINNMNRLIVNAKYSSAITASQDSMAEMDTYKRKKDINPVAQKLGSFLDWKNTTPYYVFKRFGKGGQAIFEGLMDGWDALARNSEELIAFAEKAYEVEEVREWDREVQTVELSSGESVRMTTAQLMSMYCLSKREQAVGHLLGGGIRIADIGGRGRVVSQTENYTLTANDLKTIAGMLTERQRAVADALQKYMVEKGGEWGNYVSMKRFGYRMFTEANYFPIETDANNRSAQDENQRENDLFRLLNMSATKNLVQGANNAVVIRSVFDVFTAHMTDMAKYNALALPLLDTFKWLNYVEKTKNKDGSLTTRSIQKSMEGAYGKDARSYVIQFLRDLNGTKDGGREDAFIKKGISNYKIAATGANLRVALLQITSMPRAAYAINPKYLAIGLAKWNTSGGKNSKRAVDKVGIAKWKSLGFYDTNISRNLQEMVKHDTTVGDRIRSGSMKLAELGDAWTMGVLYGAVEAELKDKGISTSSTAYDAMFNRRMREIIYQTQVVDSTMTRSQMMRSGGLATLVTSFMSEPTLAMNILGDAVFEARMKARAADKWTPALLPKVGKAFAVTAFCAGMSSLVEALFTAYRDDDEFESFAEKYKEALLGEESFWDGSLGGNINLLNNIPLVKDLIGMLQGDSTDQMYNAWLGTTVDGMKTLYKAIMEDGTMADYYRGIYKIVNGASQFSGFAAGGLMREMTTLYNVFAESLGWKRIQTYQNTVSDAAKAIYAASSNGDSETVKYYRERAALYGLEEEKINKALAKLTEEGYAAGELDKATAEKLLTGEAGVRKRDAEEDLTLAQYTADTGLEYGDMKADFIDGRLTESKVKSYRIKYGGQTEEEVEETLGHWKYEKDTGREWSELKLDYRDNVISESKLRDYLAKYGGKDEEKVEETVSNYDYQIATGRTTSAPKYWRIAYAFDTGADYSAYIDEAFNTIMYGGEKQKSRKQARSQIAQSLASYYKKEYLSIMDTPKGDAMLERILDLYEAIGYTRSYQREYIAENWVEDD